MRLQLLSVVVLALIGQRGFLDTSSSSTALGVAAAAVASASATIEVGREQQQEGSCLADDGGTGSCSSGINDDNSDATTASSTGNTSDGSTKAEDNDDSADVGSNSQCADQHENCKFWADQGECAANPPYMHMYCKRSCELCDGQIERDPIRELVDLREAKDMGVAQNLNSQNSGGFNIARDVIETTLLNARQYMENEVLGGKMSQDTVKLCKNEHADCAIWAAAGECEVNPNYMKKSCAPVCQSCDYVTIEGRCPLDPEAVDAWYPGDLDKMFEKLTSEPYLSEYDVQILSSPKTHGPWVITMENVVTEEEATRLIELGGIEGYERSADVGEKKEDGTYDKAINEGRTSTNAWCQHACYEDADAQRVIHRLSNLTGIPEPNSEYLQLLRYEKDQFYQAHHDYIPHHVDRQQGVRILTVYLYLNDVPAGGGTNFDKLGLTVMPKRGRALLWPSVLDKQPNMKDKSTSHQALPVEEGVKYGCNAWFHQRDFKTPNKVGCQ